MAEILSSIDWEKEFEGADVNSFKDNIYPSFTAQEEEKIIIYEKGNNKANKQEGEAI